MNKSFINKVVCPNCGKEGVEARITPSYQGHSTSRISAKSVTKSYNVPEKTTIISGCLLCGKTKKELELISEFGKETHEQKIRRMQNDTMQIMHRGLIWKEFV